MNIKNIKDLTSYLTRYDSDKIFIAKYCDDSFRMLKLVAETNNNGFIRRIFQDIQNAVVTSELYDSHNLEHFHSDNKYSNNGYNLKQILPLHDVCTMLDVKYKPNFSFKELQIINSNYNHLLDGKKLTLSLSTKN